MNKTGGIYQLTEAQMGDGVRPRIDITKSSINELAKKVHDPNKGVTAAALGSGLYGAVQRGTLGNFYGKFYGSVCVFKDGSWIFTGEMKFEDTYD